MIIITEEEREKARERSRKKYVMDLVSDMATAKDNGIKEGKVEMAKEMLLDGEPMAKIIKYSKLTEEKIREIEKTLR